MLMYSSDDAVVDALALREMYARALGWELPTLTAAEQTWLAEATARIRARDAELEASWLALPLRVRVHRLAIWRWDGFASEVRWRLTAAGRALRGVRDDC